MIGQEKIKTEIAGFIQNDSFPRTVLLVGESGCGKHTLSNEIAEELQLPLIDISDKLDYETITEIQLNPLPNVYLVDCTGIREREQNIILKFLEEPLKNSYIILLSVNKSTILETVLNRCFVIEFEAYIKEQLKNFLPSEDDSVLKYANTPGRVIEFSKCNIQDIVKLCDDILLKINIASFSNVLKIPEKLDLDAKSDDKDKLNFDVFSYILLYEATRLYSEKMIKFKSFLLVSDFCNDLMIKNINRRYCLEHFLFELKLEEAE